MKEKRSKWGNREVFGRQGMEGKHGCEKMNLIKTLSDADSRNLIEFLLSASLSVMIF